MLRQTVLVHLRNALARVESLKWGHSTVTNKVHSAYLPIWNVSRSLISFPFVTTEASRAIRLHRIRIQGTLETLSVLIILWVGTYSLGEKKFRILNHPSNKGSIKSFSKLKLFLGIKYGPMLIDEERWWSFAAVRIPQKFNQTNHILTSLHVLNREKYLVRILVLHNLKAKTAQVFPIACQVIQFEICNQIHILNVVNSKFTVVWAESRHDFTLDLQSTYAGIRVKNAQRWPCILVSRSTWKVVWNKVHPLYITIVLHRSYNSIILSATTFLSIWDLNIKIGGSVINFVSFSITNVDNHLWIARNEFKNRQTWFAFLVFIQKDGNF